MNAKTGQLRNIARACIDVHDRLEQDGYYPFGSLERQFLIMVSGRLHELANEFDSIIGDDNEQAKEAAPNA